MHNEAGVWQKRCRACGVTSLRGWNAPTYRELYLTLIHKYGSLVGATKTCCIPDLPVCNTWMSLQASAIPLQFQRKLLAQGCKVARTSNNIWLGRLVERSGGGSGVTAGDSACPTQPVRLGCCSTAAQWTKYEAVCLSAYDDRTRACFGPVSMLFLHCCRHMLQLSGIWMQSLTSRLRRAAPINKALTNHTYSHRDNCLAFMQWNLHLNEEVPM